MVQQYVSSHSYIHQSTVDYHTIKNRNLSKSEDLLIETDTESTLLSSTPSLFQIRKPREQHYNTLSNTRNNTLNTRKSTLKDQNRIKRQLKAKSLPRQNPHINKRIDALQQSVRSSNMEFKTL